MKTKTILGAALVAALAFTINTQAGEIGHFAPGVLNIRDFAMPEPGFYGVLYNYGYTTDQLNDSSGNKVSTVTIKAGNHFDGGKSYKLHVPADVPAAAFWSLTVYDSATRSMIQNASKDAALSSYDKLKANADGSIDLYFGPKSPAGMESNWRETVPGKGFYPMMRFYSPKAGLFDGNWKLPDIELVK